MDRQQFNLDCWESRPSNVRAIQFNIESNYLLIIFGMYQNNFKHSGLDFPLRSISFRQNHLQLIQLIRDNFRNQQKINKNNINQWFDGDQNQNAEQRNQQVKQVQNHQMIPSMLI